jgi:hypothetical protein
MNTASTAAYAALQLGHPCHYCLLHGMPVREQREYGNAGDYYASKECGMHYVGPMAAIHPKKKKKNKKKKAMRRRQVNDDSDSTAILLF